MRWNLQLANVGQIKTANLDFADLTVLVGPQATGKSITFEWLKLILDLGHVQSALQDYGMNWHKSLPEFMDLYFGEGMRSLWSEGKSKVLWNGRAWDAQHKLSRKAKQKEVSVFLIPAQRVLTLRDGWPRPFSDYSPGDPFSVRWFSEKLRLLMEQEIGSSAAVFPKKNRLKREYRDLLGEVIFGRFGLSVDVARSQRRLVLKPAEDIEPLPYMVWSAGQREFVPLLLGFYWLMPPTKVSRRDSVEWVVIEEPEMGLHPRAITTVLLLVLELLMRDYRVCISTHSPQVLELVWALQALQDDPAQPDRVLRLFDAQKTQGLSAVAKRSLEKSFKVYYFEGSSGTVRDISKLDPSSSDEWEATWGAMVEFSQRANEAVATAKSASASIHS